MGSIFSAIPFPAKPPITPPITAPATAPTGPAIAPMATPPAAPPAAPSPAPTGCDPASPVIGSALRSGAAWSSLLLVVYSWLRPSSGSRALLSPERACRSARSRSDSVIDTRGAGGKEPGGGGSMNLFMQVSQVGLRLIRARSGQSDRRHCTLPWTEQADRC